LEANILYFIKAELWRYKLKHWTLGNWGVQAELLAAPGGGYELVTTKVGFDGEKGRPSGDPDIEQQLIPIAELIELYLKANRKISSKDHMRRLVYQLKLWNANLSESARLKNTLDLKKINGTDLDIDNATQLLAGHAMARGDSDSRLMSDREWVYFSTTEKSVFSGITDRKSVKVIDAAVKEYHSAKGKARRLALLAAVELQIRGYRQLHFRSRQDAALWLLQETIRERERLSEMPESATQQ
jgi:hypothetical protein